MESNTKILVVQYRTELATVDMIESFRKMGIEVSEYDGIKHITDVSEEDVYKLSNTIREQRITYLFSIHLIYTAAIAAYDAGVKYICYIWDAPYTYVYSPVGRLDNCWYTTFDKSDYKRWQEAGLSHILYQPLAVSAAAFRKWNDKRKKLFGNTRYIHEISFVGQLYDTNSYDKNLDKIPPDIREYFESIFEEAAFRWDGINRIYGKTSPKIIDYIKLNSQDFQIAHISDTDNLSYFEQFFLVRKIANIERTIILSTLAEKYDVTLYTKEVMNKSMLGDVKIMPSVAWGEAASMVYAGSRINLNIALKGIEGGTPQRVMEIMAAGGFMMSTYCPETAELFEEDREIVMFKTPEELFDKVDYYLKHDDERKAIARRGQEKVLKCYTYDKSLRKLLNWVESER